MQDRCSFCILPTNLPGIDLDKDGKCKYCREFEMSLKQDALLSVYQTAEMFEAIVERLRGKGKYDCLVPLSGGKDSSYILYILVTRYRLKVLAFNFDNSFQHPQAVKNIYTLVNELGVDLVIYKPRQDMMRNLFRTFLRRAGEFCTPCNMLIATTKFRLAEQNNIRAIMSGSFRKVDPGIAGLSPALYFDRKYYFEVAKGLLNDREKGYYVVPSYPITALRRLIGTAPQDIDVLNYLKPSFTDMDETLREIGWRRPADAMQHGDCLLDPLKDYIMYKKWGCSELTGLHSALVRAGELTRERALKEALAETRVDEPEILHEFLRNIKMTDSEFEDSLKKDFREIPNMRNTVLFQMAKKVVRRFARIKGRI